MIGVASAVISHYLADTALGEKLRLFIMVGVCGGFTTFSTFCNDAITLGRTNIYASILYVGLSIVIGFVAVMLGYEIRRFF